MLKKFGKRLIRKVDLKRAMASPAQKKARSIHQIAIFGYADAAENARLYDSVVRVSRKLAEAGYTIVDGGGPGVMKAATVGAKLAGGRAIGVTLYPRDMTHFEGRDKSNDIDVEIKTHTYIDRTMMLLKEGQVYVVFNGGTGTISEFGMAWGLARLYFGHHKPLILYGKFWENIISAFKKNMHLREEELKVFKICYRPEDVLNAIRDFEEELQNGEHNHLKAERSDFKL